MQCLCARCRERARACACRRRDDVRITKFVLEEDDGQDIDKDTQQLGNYHQVVPSVDLQGDHQQFVQDE